MTDPVAEIARIKGAWDLLCTRLQRDPNTSEEDDTCSLRSAWKAMLAYGQQVAAQARLEGERAGMEKAANICGSLAETTYDDSDGFAAATGCEAAIYAAIRDTGATK